MEEQYSEGECHELASPCVTAQLEDGSPAKEQSHDQNSVESEFPENPSAIKRWEIGPLLQSFKSKMASFTEIVMSPVRLFKPTEPLSSVTLPDQQEPLTTESDVENSTQTLEVETQSANFRNGQFPKRPSSEKVQCSTAPKRHRVAQRLNFCTVSTSNNHKAVLDDIQMHNELAPNEENQIDCDSNHSQTVLKDETLDVSSCKSNIPFLRARLNLSTDIALCPPNATRLSSCTCVLRRLSREQCIRDSDKELDISTNKTCSNKSATGATSSDFDNKDKDTSTNSQNLRMATRKSPRKKLLTGLTVLETRSNILDVEMKESQSENSLACADYLAEVSDLLSSVLEKRTKKCKATSQTNKDLQTRRNCDMLNAEEGRSTRSKKVKDNGISLDINHLDESYVQVRKKRKGLSTTQQFKDSNFSADMSEEMRQNKISQSENNLKCRPLLIANDVGDATGGLSLQNGNIISCSSPPLQPQEPEKNTEPRMTRRHLKDSSDAFQKRNLRPHRHRDSTLAAVVDPAGPSKPSKRKLISSEHSVHAAEEQKTSLFESREDIKALLPSDLNVPLHSETKQRRTTRKAKHLRRKCGFVKTRNCAIGGEDDAESQGKVTEVRRKVSSTGSSSNRLLRSYSCPEIPSLIFNDCHLSQGHVHDSNTTSPNRKSVPAPLPVHHHSPSKRTRRHTVCSVEIEREIAPLCLRKEVYPSSRGSPLCPSSPYSPSTSLTVLASCFLSSPLAFLSKSSSQGRSHASDASTGSISAASSFVTSSSPSFSSPYTSTLTSCHTFTGQSSVVTPSPETPSASVSSLCSAFSQSSLEGDQVLQMECEEAIAEEERSDFDFKLSAAISEEKALSDSEIKTDAKDGQRGKVSSIRIRKKIPKPQNNLTPMGLPKVIRIKKKDFSLEEIYTNKNFSKPPDGRLETIFEVPLSRRDGSQAVVGPKKLKRFVEFPELGVARKPKKPLVGVVAGGGAQRKAGGNSGICRTRRGVGGSSKVEESLILQELESLLCSKLEELDSWMALQQVTG